MTQRATDITVLSAAQRRDLEREMLAKMLHRRRAGGLSPRDPDQPVPASLAQRRLWFFHKLRPAEPLYQSWACFRLTGALHTGALAAAVDSVVRRHEILRTRIVAGASGAPLQVVDPPEPRGIEMHEADGPDTWAAAERLMTDLVRRPFDLAGQWPFAPHLIRVADDEHLLVLTWHHIAFDGLSWSILCRDLRVGFAAALQGGPPDLPDLPVQYADFALWQDEQEGSAAWQEQLDYWRGQLAGIPSAIDLPLDRPRPRQHTHGGATVKVSVPATAAQALRRLGAAAGCTPFMTLMAAFHTLLHRYSGDETVLVGTPVAGRTDPKLSQLIGFFVNTVAVRGDFDDDPSFRTLLTRVGQTLLQAIDHQDVPFDVVANELGIERQLSYNPVFQAMFQLNAEGPEDLTLPGVRCERVWPTWGSCDFDLHLYLTEEASGAIGGRLAYSTDVFDRSTAERIAEHYGTLLRALVDAPDEPVGQLSFLPPAERAMILDLWSGTGEHPVADRLFHEYVDEHAATRPDATAIEFRDERISYGDLVRRADRFAHYLRTRGVGPESVVGMLLEPGIDVFVTVLGIHKAGGAFLSMDTRFPRPWIEFVLADSHARLVVTTSGFAGLAGDTATICLDREADAIAAEPVGPVGDRPDPRTTAYMIYTGGSTGRPKGVLVEHRNLANHLAIGIESHRLTPADRCLQFMSHSFDVWVEEMAATLSVGATLVVRDAGFDLAPARFVTHCADLRLSNVHVPTSYWHQLVDAGAAAGLARLPHLRLVSIGGEPAAPDRVRRWQAEVGTAVQLRNGYGPSECTITPGWIDLTSYEFVGAVPIGRPIRNGQMYVLDKAGQPVGVGVVGELYIAGRGVSRGYAGRPDLTAKAFLPNPFTTRPGTRLYRTGDRARYLPDGNLVMLGRYDDQIKLRGYRIEPHDVEMTLRQHPDVREALVRVREDIPGDRRLVAYVATLRADQGEQFGEELRDFMTRRLPAYQVPAAYVALPAIPRTPSGKLDAARLPAPAAVTPPADRPVVEPRDDVERRLVALWRELLGVARIGIREDFFAHGGHSLLAVQLVARIQHEFGTVLPVSALFPQATVARLAELIRSGAQVADQTVVSVRSEPGGAEAVLVHPVGGDVMAYSALAAALPGPVRLFALRSPSLGSRRVPFSDLPALAAAYLAELRAAGVRDPEVFAGWSVGGLVALELARQEHSISGRAVPVLAIDSKIRPLGDLDPAVLDTPAWLLSGFVEDLTTILGLDADRKLTTDDGWARGGPPGGEDDVRQRMTLLSSALAASGLAGEAVDVDGLIRRFEVYCDHTRYAARYDPGRYPGRIVLALAAQRPDADKVVARWREVAGGGLDVHLIDADHYSIMTRGRVEHIARVWP